MASYLHPGVYVEEIPSGSKPIEGVATSVAAFVGSAKQGPAGEAVLIQGFDEYEALYGPLRSKDDSMGLAVDAFFKNGGRTAYIARLVSTDPPAKASFAEFAGDGTGGGIVLKISASSVGKWGDELRIQIDRPDEDRPLLFELRVGRIVDDEFEAEEIFKRLVMNDASDDYVLTRVNGESRLVEIALGAGVAANVQNGSLTGAELDSAAGLFSDANGIRDGMKLTLNVDGLGAKRIVLPDKGDLGLPGTNIGDGGKVAEAIEKAVVALGPTKDAYKKFSCSYAGHKFTLKSGTKSLSSSVVVYGGDGSPLDLAKFLKLDPGSEPVSAPGAEKVVPTKNLGDAGLGVALADGGEGPPAPSDYATFFSTRLVKKRDVSIVVLPGRHMAADGSGDDAIAAAIDHCESTRSRMVIVDPPPDVELKDGEAVEKLALPTSTYSVLYYPWVKVRNPGYDPNTSPNAAPSTYIAPSAFAAGMWSRVDGTRGVWKAPAGVRTSLLGAQDLKVDVGDGEQDQLNPLGVNCLRRLPSFGRVVWGARTLSTRADPEWRYVPVRRTAIFIEQSIYGGIQWAVFEPNNHLLWSALRLNIEGFMDGLFRAGAFQGEKASDAYFVRCGLGDTMRQPDIDRGQVIVIVGFAPVKPAEFVIVRIQQKVGEE